MKKPTKKQRAAALELLTRDRAHESLLDFAKAIDIPGAPVTDGDEWLFESVETGLADHHALMLDVIERVVVGKLPRAMFFLPPGSAKSTFGSVVAPTWIMGKIPNTKIILTSYGSDLAKKHGRKARQIVKSSRYVSIFATEISNDTAAADGWALQNGSEYMAGGILSGITGNRASGLIIDDPIKGREAADSDTICAKTWEAYQDDLRTRLIPGGWEILIQTRWSEDDLAGRLLPADYDGQTGMIKCKDGRDWYVVCLPAQCERADDPLGRKVGDYLWPEWFTPEHFEGFKATARTWNALFQQRPASEEGTFFKRAWFRRYTPAMVPADLNKYMTSDHAPTDGDDSDPNVARVWGVDHLGDLYMLDGFNHKATMDKTADRIIDLIRKHRPFAWFPEDDNNFKSAAPFIKKLMMERQVYTVVAPISPHGGNKAVKAQSFQGMASMGRVWLPVGPEGDAILDELVKFPAGAHDEEVDNGAIIGIALMSAHPAIIPQQSVKKSLHDRRLDSLETGASDEFDEFERQQQAQTSDTDIAGGCVFFNDDYVDGQVSDVDRILGL